MKLVVNNHVSWAPSRWLGLTLYEAVKMPGMKDFAPVQGRDGSLWSGGQSIGTRLQPIFGPTKRT